MEHVVFYTGPDGSERYRRAAGRDEAVRQVEALRNTEGAGDCRVYALTEVPLRVKTVYVVELSEPAAEAAPAAPPAPAEAAAPEPEAPAAAPEAAPEPEPVMTMSDPLAELTVPAMPDPAPVAEAPEEPAEPEAREVPEAPAVPATEFAPVDPAPQPVGSNGNGGSRGLGFFAR